MELTVVIPCRGHSEPLARCLRSVATQQASFPFEVIVVDSASEDAVARMTLRFEGVKLIRSPVPLLAGPARNLGVSQAQGRYVVFIDADCVAEPGWLEAAHRALADETVRIAGGPVGDLLERRWIASADNLLQFTDLPFSRPQDRARYFPSCNMAMRTADFRSVGQFPETGLNAGEDILLCNTVLSRWRESLLFVPAMAVRHHGRTAWRDYLRHHRGFGYARALHRLHVQPWQLAWGRSAVVVPLVTLKRLGYVLRSVVRYRGWDAWRAIALFPLALPGLWSSALGFHRGCRDSRPPALRTEPSEEP